MPYNLKWHVPERVLLLTLVGDYSLEDAKDVNQCILDEIDRTDNPVILLIDAIHMHRPFNFTSIRDAQTYIDHSRLQDIYVIASDRLIKLAMIVILNLTRAHLHMFDSLENATSTLQRQLARLSSSAVEPTIRSR